MSYSIATRNVDGKCCWVLTLVMYLWLFPKGRQLQENKNFLAFHLNSCLEIFAVIRNNGVKIVCTILFHNAFIKRHKSHQIRFEIKYLSYRLF